MENKSNDKSGFIKNYKQYKENLKFLGGNIEWTEERVTKLNKVEIFEAIKGFNDLIIFLDSVLYAYEEGAQDWEEEATKLKERCDKMEAALKELCYLKKLKEERGRTNEYIEKQPVAWERAFELIKDGLPATQPILTDDDLRDWEEDKLTPEQISDRKEAIEWYRNPDEDQHQELKKGAEKLRLALVMAVFALKKCYDVTDYPADGETSQDSAIRIGEEALTAWKEGEKEVNP